MNRLACIGDSCVDYYDSQDLKFVGGNPVNFAVYARRLGGEASFIGGVGNDEDGALVRMELESRGVDVSHVQILDGPTPNTHVRMENGNRVFVSYDAGAMTDFSLREEDFAFIAEHDFAVSAVWGTCEKELGRIQAMGVPVAFDCADLPFAPVCQTALPNVDVAFFSDDSADESQLREIMRGIAAKGPSVVVAMRGPKGSMVWDGETFYHQDAIDCVVVDTLGAGDSYIAGFLLARLAGKSMPECMRAGSENSAVTIGYLGAW